MLSLGAENLCREGEVYWLELGRGTGLGAGFLVGLEMPKLIRKKRKPLRRESRKLMA